MITSKKLTIENLRRKNFAPSEFLESKTAAASLKDKDLTNDIDNTPNLAQLTAGMALADKAQELSDKLSEKLGYRVKITVNSGFRSLLLNKAVGGSKGSFHCQFLAIDFNVEGFEPHEVVLMIKELKISVDKVFVERGCVHMQTCINDAQNRNFYGTAFKNKKGEWVVLNEIKKMA